MPKQMISTDYQLFNLLIKSAQEDVDILLDRLFSGQLLIPCIYPEVVQTFDLMGKLAVAGIPPAVFIPLLRPHLETHMKQGKRIAQLWTTRHPDPEELVAAWEAQCRGFDRWQLFMNVINSKTHLDLAVLKETLTLAFELFEPQRLMFDTEKDRQNWVQRLCLEQVKDTLAYQEIQTMDPDAEPCCYLEENEVVYQGQRVKLRPAQTILLEALWSRTPQLVDKLVTKALPHKKLEPTRRGYLSRRISDLNKLLRKLLGNAPDGHWIISKPSLHGLTYQLALPA